MHDDLAGRRTGERIQILRVWVLWHTSREHRTDVGRVLPRLVTDARTAARTAEGAERRAACAVLADVYALVQHEVVWASEAELTWTAADRAMAAAQDADTPEALAGAAWTLGMVQRSAGDTAADRAMATDAAGLQNPASKTAPTTRPGWPVRWSCTQRRRAPAPGGKATPGGTGTRPPPSQPGSPPGTTTRGPCSAPPTSRCTRYR
jgi:hypothetical protein